MFQEIVYFAFVNVHPIYIPIRPALVIVSIESSYIYWFCQFFLTVTEKGITVLISLIRMWALGSITTNKVRRSNGIPAEVLQILKDDAVEVLNSICQQIWTTQQWPKVRFHSNPKERQCQRMLKLPHNCTHLTH